MSVTATKADLLSTVLVDDLDQLIFNYNYQIVECENASDLTVQPGSVLVFNATNDNFNLLAAADVAGIAALTVDFGTSDYAKLCIVVGDENGIGKGGALTIGTTATNVSALFRGQATVKASGLKFADTLNAAQLKLVQVQLEQQGIAIRNVATQVATKLYS